MKNSINTQILQPFVCRNTAMEELSNLPASATTVGKRLEGKVAIITGAAGGIGACTAKLFIQHGAKVIISDVLDDLGTALCQDVASENLSYVHCDVTNESDVKNLVETAISKYGKLDIMYSNAGIGGQFHVSSIVDAESDDLKRVMDVNVHGAFLCAKYAARAMVPARKGVILFTASNASVTSGIGSNSFGASKVAIVGLARNLCVDLGKYGIRVNCISPFLVATPATIGAFNVNQDRIEKLYESISILKGVVLKMEDVAQTAIFLASDESKVISGQNIVIDGGYGTTHLSFKMKIQELMSGNQN
ncbi:hypothetical protein Nepgr_028191 [Nepenthes gracilis]|uniref:Uncharacterized protein n=1 Tax=Nepenthes gracilis TaxID=150966 RepID=A0AAD3TBW0_NEPGR|nr:hypothetical protein Nepgr_028191 [Nepenthes gracilis]